MFGIAPESVSVAFCFSSPACADAKWSERDEHPNRPAPVGAGAFDPLGGPAAPYAVPEGIATIGDWAFIGCGSLTSITIPGSVTGIGADAFRSCSNLTSVSFGSGVTSIGDDAFSDCVQLSSLSIPASVKDIGAYAFASCFRLETVNVGVGVTNIGDAAFSWCASLQAIYFPGNAPTFNWEDLSTDSGVTVYYLPGTVGWDGFYDIYGIPIAPWFLPNPVVLAGSAGFDVQANSFGFVLSWATNESVVVEACTNLANPVWEPLSTNALTDGSSSFEDPQWTNFPTRFYRPRPF